MQSKIRITVPLTEQEWNALRLIAQIEKREPRMQASHLINHALFGNKNTVLPCQADGVHNNGATHVPAV